MVARGEPHEMDDDGQHVITRTNLHDLRNRVAAIKGFAQLLERQIGAAPSQDGRLVHRVTALRLEIERLEEAVAGLSSQRPDPDDHRGDDAHPG